MIDLRFARLEYTDWGACTHFEDGTKWGAEPHDTPHYHFLAYRYGHHGDTLVYCQTHELCHHIVCEAFGSHSPVLWALAHDEKPCPMIAAAEEALTMALHRYAMTREPPFIDGVDWSKSLARYLELAR